MPACAQVRSLAQFLRDNPQAVVLLAICIVLGLGTFIAVVYGLVSSGSTTTSGQPADAIFGLRALLG